MGWLRRGSKKPGPVRPARAPSGDEGPVDLARELRALASPGAAAGRALAAVRALSAEVRDPAALVLLRALERGAETGQLALPPLPEVVLRVRDLIESPDLRIADLEREIQLDPALATRIVGVANSPFYGSAKPAASVAEAIVRVGLRQTRHLVLALALRSRVLRAPGHDLEVADLWGHSLATSLAAQSLAALLGSDPEEAALVGLVHDVGRVAILAAQGDLERSSRGQVRVGPEPSASIADALHPALGAMLADAWSLAPAVVAAISHHHSAATAPEPVAPLVRAAAGADQLARVLVRADAPGELPDLEGIDPEITGAALEESRESYAELAKLL
jgi:HD-like signal output (HDOD) protein